MNWKSIISILALLAIGFVTGFFTNRFLTIKTAQKIAVMRQAKGMENRLYEVLQLEEAQKSKLAPIIKNHFEELAQLNKTHREQRATVIKDLSEAILPSLTAEQKASFEKFSRRLKRMQGKWKKRREERVSGKKRN